MKEVNQVFETNDYSMFKTLGGNRDVNELHVARLRKSFTERYLFSPILVNNKMEVIDGQHRLKAAIELNLPVRFIKLNGYGLREVQILNTNMKNWKREDYLDGYCDLQYPEYLKLREFMRKYPDFPITAAEVICTQSVRNGIQDKELGYRDANGYLQAAKYFQEGKLVIPDFRASCDIAEMILLLKPFYDGYNRALFVRSMVGMLKNENFSIAELIQKLTYQPNAIQHCTNITQYKLLIEDIYNYRRREKVSLRF